MGILAKKSFAINLILFISMALITIGSGYYRQAVAKEKAQFTLALPAEKQNTEVLVNIAEQGLPKKILQPHRILITSGHSGGITNRGKEPLLVKVQLEGFKGEVLLKSTDQSFNSQTGMLTRPLKENQSFNLEVEFNLPKESIKECEVNKGNIIFLNSKTGTVIGNVPVKIINDKGGTGNFCEKNGGQGECCK